MTVPSFAALATPAERFGSAMSSPAVKFRKAFCAWSGLVVRAPALSARPPAQSARNASACATASGWTAGWPGSNGPHSAAYAPAAATIQAATAAMAVRRPRRLAGTGRFGSGIKGSFRLQLGWLLHDVRQGAHVRGGLAGMAPSGPVRGASGSSAARVTFSGPRAQPARRGRSAVAQRRAVGGSARGWAHGAVRMPECRRSRQPRAAGLGGRGRRTWVACPEISIQVSTMSNIYIKSLMMHF